MNVTRRHEVGQRRWPGGRADKLAVEVVLGVLRILIGPAARLTGGGLAGPAAREPAHTVRHQLNSKTTTLNGNAPHDDDSQNSSLVPGGYNRSASYNLDLLKAA